MAITSTSFHTRSLSLPSTSHPLNARIEDHLRRQSASQASSSSTSSSICRNLCSIKDFYEEMTSFVHLPHSKILCRREVENVLEGSLSLLDVSSSTLDALSEMKKSILNLQSALRRGSENEGVCAYLMSRKRISKAVSKCLANLKKVEKSCTSGQPKNAAIPVTMLKDTEAISLSTLKSVLSFLMGKKAISQTRGWSLVANLVKSKQMPCEAENGSEVEKMDRVLSSLSEKQMGDSTKFLVKQLETLEMIIHKLEDGLQSVSRCLVKIRVSLLSVLNH